MSGCPASSATLWCRISGRNSNITKSSVLYNMIKNFKQGISDRATVSLAVVEVRMDVRGGGTVGSIRSEPTLPVSHMIKGLT